MSWLYAERRSYARWVWLRYRERWLGNVRALLISPKGMPTRVFFPFASLSQKRITYLLNMIDQIFLNKTFIGWFIEPVYYMHNNAA